MSTTTTIAPIIKHHNSYYAFFAKGKNGKSVYDLWLEAGNEGTAEEFLDTLKGETGASAYVHIRYGTTSNPSTLLTTPADYIGVYSGTSATPPLTAASYTWYKIKGETGASAYVHIRYGTTSNPSTLLTTPADYIGVYSGTSATAPSTAASYTWYKYKGEAGLSGASAYVHIRYGTTSNPSTLLTTPADYIGIYSGTSATAPSTAASYTWYKIKGEQGDPATNAATATKLATARTIALSTGATGTATSFDGSSNITIVVTALAASYLSGAIPSTVTATTQSVSENSTKIATTAFVKSLEEIYSSESAAETASNAAAGKNVTIMRIKRWDFIITETKSHSRTLTVENVTPT